MATTGRNTELQKNTLIIAFGQICTKFLWLILLPIYTRLISPEEYGTYDLYSTYWVLLGFVIFIQIEQAIFRSLIDERGNFKGQCAVFSTSLVICMVNSVSFTSVFMIAGCLFDITYRYFLLSITVASAWCGFLQQFSRGMGDNKTYAISGIVSAIVQLGLNVVLVLYLKIGIIGLFWAYLAGNVACSFFLVIRKRVWQYCHINYFNKEIAKSLILYSLPLIPNQISWWVIYASDRMITAIAFGTVANGILAVASKYSTLLSSAYSVFHLAWVESASAHIDDSDNRAYFESIVDNAIRGFFAIFILFLPAYSLVFPYMINSSYADSYGLLPMYLLAAMFNVVQGLYSVVYIAKKKTSALAKSTIMSAVISVVTYIALIKTVGLLAAGISSVAAYVVVTIWRYYDVKKYINVSLNLKIITGMCFLSTIVMVVYYFGNFALNIATLFIACIYSVFINKQMIKKSLKNVYSWIRRR